MIINELTLNEFLSFKEKNIVINSSNALIFGSNGSGKSTLIHAILFALYGKSIRDMPLIKEASVSLSFTIDSDNYIINRTLDKVKLLKNDKAISEKEILNTLGSFDNFISKCLIKQEYLKILEYDIIDALKETFCIYKYDEYNNKIAALLEDKNSTLKKLEEERKVLNLQLKESRILDRKRLEEEIGKIEKEKKIYEQALKKAENRLTVLEKREENTRKITSSVDVLKTKITMLEEELKNKEALLEKLEIYNDINAVKKEYNEFVRLQNKIRALEKKRTRYDTLTNMISLLESIIEDKNKASIQLSNDLKRIKERYKSSNLETKRLREKMIQLDKSKIELEEKRYRLYAEIDLAKEQLSEILTRVKTIMKSKKCHICNQSLPNAKELAAHMTDEANNLKMIIKEKEKELSDIIVKLREVDTTIHQVENMISKAEVSKSMVENLEKQDIDIKNELTLLNTKLSKYKKELSALRFDPKSYEKDVAKYEELAKKKIIEKYVIYTSKFNEWKMLNNDINKINGTISLLNKRLNSLLKKDISKIYDDITNTKEEIVRIKTKLEVYDILLAKKKEELEALKGDGSVKSRLDTLNLSIKDINDEIEALNELRSMLDDVLSDIIKKTIDLLEPYLKAMNLQLSFNANTLFVNDVEFTNLSRGEKTLIYLALRVAYMQALNAPLIIIDNNLSLLDRDKVELLLSNIKVPLLATSHQDLRPFFSKVIEL